MPLDPPPRRILVIQLRHLGDVLLTTPAVRALRRAYPEARIDFLVDRGARATLLGNPDIDRIIERPSRASLREGAQVVLEARRARYDLVIDFQHKLRSAVVALCSGAARSVSWGHTARRLLYRPPVRRAHPQGYMGATKIALLREAGLVDVDDRDLPRPILAISDEAHAWAAATWTALGLDGGQVVAINPGSRRADRRWAGFPALARRIVAATGAKVLVSWGPGERELAETVVAGCDGGAVLAPATSIEQLGALLARCALLVGNDSAARHIAVAVDTPTLTISIGTTPETWTYPGPGHRCIESPDAAAGDAAIARVFDAVEDVLRESASRGPGFAEAGTSA
jgi:ADP-heptose:LPS heptosyltransferase